MPYVRHHKGFTLVELLVVIAIIALLIGMLLPTLKSARDMAKLSNCRSNQRQVGLALYSYSVDNRDWLPPQVSQPLNAGGSGGDPATSVNTFMAYLVESEWWDSTGAAVTAPWRTNPVASSYLPSNNKTTLCPTEENFRITSYAGVEGTGWTLVGGSGTTGYPPQPGYYYVFGGARMDMMPIGGWSVASGTFTYSAGFGTSTTLTRNTPKSDVPLLIERNTFWTTGAFPTAAKPTDGQQFGLVQLAGNNSGPFQVSSYQTTTNHQDGNRAVFYADGHVDVGVVRIMFGNTWPAAQRGAWHPRRPFPGN